MMTVALTLTPYRQARLADYGVSHTTLMNAVARYKAAQRKAEREVQQ